MNLRPIRRTEHGQGMEPEGIGSFKKYLGSHFIGFGNRIDKKGVERDSDLKTRWMIFPFTKIKEYRRV